MGGRLSQNVMVDSYQCGSHQLCAVVYLLFILQSSPFPILLYRVTESRNLALTEV